MVASLVTAGPAELLRQVESLARDVRAGVLDGIQVAHSGAPRDEALLAAVAQASVIPARALGLPNPELTAGAAADMVVLDNDLAVIGVLRKGHWVVAPA